MQVRETMSRIREVLVNRQLSWNQAQAMIGQKPIAEILHEDTPTFEEDNDAEWTDAPLPQTPDESQTRLH